MPIPYMYFESSGKPGELANDTAVAALGSKIYLIGGNFCTSHSTLPRDVYVIDTVEEEFPEIMKMSSVLNWGKRQPIAWTIGGNIYVMPHTFLAVKSCKGRKDMGEDMDNGRFFERYDPVSDSWTVLPNPPVENIGVPEKDFDPFLVTSHTVLGSTLLISVGTLGFVFALDTAQTDPDPRWTKIQLLLDHGPLNVLPFDPSYSTPLGDKLVLCYPRALVVLRGNRLSHLLKEELDMDCDEGYYVCRFGDFDDKGDLKASIVPLDGSSLGMRWAKFFHPDNYKSTQVTLFLEHLFLVAKIGRDYDRSAHLRSHSCTEPEIGDPFWSFELFRVSQAPDGQRQYQASRTRSALFQLDDESVAHLELFRCFVMEDGLFVN